MPCTVPAMGKHLSSRVRAIRLSNELWGRIEAEADGLDMSVNEFVRRRLAKSFERVQENRNSFDIDRNPAQESEDEEVVSLS